MASKKRVVRSLSDLAEIQTVDLTKAAVETSEEESSGGFVVGEVIEETPEPIKAQDNRPSTDEQIEKLSAELDRVPQTGDSVYYADNDAIEIIEHHSDIEDEPGQAFWFNPTRETYIKTEELQWNDEGFWDLIVPEWAKENVEKLRAELNVPEIYKDRWIFEIMEDVGTENVEQLLFELNKEVEVFLEMQQATLVSEDEIELLEEEEEVDLIEAVEEEVKVLLEEPIQEEDIQLEPIDEELSEEDVVVVVGEDEDTRGMYEVDAVDFADTDHLREPVELQLPEAVKQEMSLLDSILSLDEAPEVPDVTIVHGDNVVTVSDGEVEIVDGEGQLLEPTTDQRESLMAEIQPYLPPGRLVNNSTFEHMTIEDLKNHLALLKLNNGGSPAAATILREVDTEYEKLINDPDTKRRLALLEKKGTDFHIMAQKMSRIMGNDPVIKGMRYQEYHDLLTHLTRGVTVIFKEIAAAADYMGIKMPIDELVPSLGAVPILEGMAIDEKTAMYVLRVLLRQVEHWHHATLLLQGKYDNDAIELQNTKDRLKEVSDRLKEELATRETLLSSVKERFIEMSEYYIFVSNGGFLAMKDDEESLSVKNLTISTDIREAMFLSSKKAAERIIEVIVDREKFSAYTFTIRRLAAIEV